MIKAALKLDGKRLHKTGVFKAKRPSEYWLLFFKEHLFRKESWSWKFKWYYLLALIPILLIVGLIYLDVEIQSIIVTSFFSIIFTIVTIGVLKDIEKKVFLPIKDFCELAKFIIYIKGDVYRNLISIRINASKIEAKKNLLRPEDIGLKNANGTRYKPYQLERYFSQFSFNDGSACMVSLYQISLRVITNKRRSSGKYKIKMKHKHKFFYQLVLKLKASDYSISENFSNKDYEIALNKESGYHLVKIKFKKKASIIAKELDMKSKHSTSIYTKMLKHLIDKKILLPKTKQRLIN